MKTKHYRKIKMFVYVLYVYKSTMYTEYIDKEETILFFNENDALEKQKTYEKTEIIKYLVN